MSRPGSPRRRRPYVALAASILVAACSRTSSPAATSDDAPTSASGPRAADEAAASPAPPALTGAAPSAPPAAPPAPLASPPPASSDAPRDASTDAAHGACELTAPEERKALEACAISRFGMALGYMGAFTARIEMKGDALPRVRVLGRTGWQTARAGDACDEAQRAVASHLPCTWDARGPFPAWTIRVVTP